MDLKANFPEILLDLFKKYKIDELKNLEFTKKGTICFADISGFTPLSEALMQIGAEGSEILNKILNFYYGKIIEIVKKHNGDVLSFAGDALNIYFEKEENAINSSVEIQNFFKEKEKIETPIGSFPISIKIGIAKGCLKFYILMEEGFINPVFEGEPINKAAEAEHHSKAGEIVIFKDNSFFKIKEKTKNVDFVEKNSKLKEIDNNILLDFLHPFFKDAFLKNQTKYLNEHRKCGIIFINLWGGKLREIYKNTARILKKYNGYFLKVDCGDKGDKFLILFGAPFQLENPLHSSYDFLLEFKELQKKENFSFKGGLNYSNVFVGFLGSHQRFEYTCLGDGVNLSARLMQISEEGEILSPKETAEKARDEFYFNPVPPVQLKGKKGFFNLEEIKGKRTYKPPITFFYNRKKEIENLKENFDGGNFFLIFGEKGSGKSIFTTYFLDEVIKKPYIYINCLFSEKEIPYHSLKKFLNIFLKYKFKEKEPKDAFSSYFKEKLKEFEKYENNLINLFFDLNLKEEELEPEFKKGLIFKTISEIIKDEDLILFLDNGNNIDFPSFEFIKNFHFKKEGKFKTIINMREKEEGFDFSLEIKNFEKEEVKGFLKGFLKVKDIPKNFLEKISNLTKGNPLLLKETISSCISSGYISIDEEFLGILKIDPLKEPPLSDNLENLIISKLDLYPIEDKNLIKKLSIYGTKIDLNIYNFLEKEVEVAKTYSDFFFFNEKENTLYFIDENYQKTIYESLEFDFKKEEHLKIGDFISLNLKDSSEKLNLLTYHYSFAEDKKALPFLKEISKKTEELFDIKSSINYLEKYLKISDKYKLFSDEEVLRLSNLYLLSGFPDKGIKILEEKEENFKKEYLFDFNLNLSNFYKSMGQFQNSLKFIERAKVFVKNDYDLFLARVQEGRTLGQMGEFKKAYYIIKNIIENFIDFKDKKEYYSNLLNFSFFKVQKGKPKDALKIIKSCLSFFKNKNLLKEQITTYINISTIYADFFGDYESSLKYSKKAYFLSLKFGFLEKEALLKLEHNMGLYYLVLGNFKSANEFLKKSILKGKDFISDYLYKSYCIKAQLELYKGNIFEFKENLKKAEEISKILKRNKEEIFALNLYFYYLLKDKENYLKNLKEYDDLIKEEKMENLKPEFLNFKAEGSLLFGNKEKFIKKEIENFKNCMKIKNIYEAYRALRFLYLASNDEKYFKKMKCFQKILKDRKFKVEFFYFNYLRKKSKKNKEILLKNIKKYPYFDIKLQTYEAFSIYEKNEKLRRFYEKNFMKLKERLC